MFRKILLWFGLMLGFSLFAFLATNYWLTPRARFSGEMMRRLTEFQLSEAIRAYQTGGPESLRETLARIDAGFPARHSLLDGSRRDLVTGLQYSQDDPAFDPPKKSVLPVGRSGPRAIAFARRQDGATYYLLVQIQGRADPLSNITYYWWIVLVIVLLCYVLAWRLTIPVRQLREAVTRFGTGNLTVRMLSRRRDELGDLARAFDEMAERIQTLLTAERRLLQDVSHELRSPLARLRVSLELARSSKQPLASLDRLERELDRLTILVNSLIEVTRAEGDPAARAFVPVDLPGLLQSIVESCRIEAGQRECEIDLFVREPVTCQGDEELLYRAVENVLRNAIRHAPENSTVDVDLTAEPTTAVLHIRDYGPGVPEEELHRLFAPFYRVEPDRSRENGGGVGLGLSIADRAVRVHHGEIKARNAYPGLLVELRLPR
jgi:two-component system sensor histidine kinase CpxA